MLKEVKGTYCGSCIHANSIEIVNDDDGRSYQCFDEKVIIGWTDGLDDECNFYKEKRK